MKYVLYLAIAYLVLGGMTWMKKEAERPLTCPRGHTDLYYLGKWKCRICQSRKRRKQHGT